MSIQNWSDDIMVVDLQAQPNMVEEIQMTIDSVCHLSSNVVLDLGDIDSISSSGMAKLLKLRKILNVENHCLIICNLKPRVLNIFRLTGLVDVFRFSDDKLSALAALQMAEAVH